jgi:hypothetical protein
MPVRVSSAPLGGTTRRGVGAAGARGDGGHAPGARGDAVRTARIQRLQLIAMGHVGRLT